MTEVTSPERESRPPAPTGWRALLAPDRLLGLAFMFTGAGLVGHIVFDASLRLTVLCSFAAAAAFFSSMYVLGDVNGVDLRHRIKVGLVAGIAATIAYDVSRALTWKLFLSGVWPFEAFRHFGWGLIGQEASESAAVVAGTIFHASNGVLFSLTYVVWLGSRKIWPALAWGLMLEVFTLLLYPNWLGITQFAEFTEISAIGHVAFGGTLGLVTRRGLSRQDEAVQ